MTATVCAWPPSPVISLPLREIVLGAWGFNMDNSYAFVLWTHEDFENVFSMSSRLSAAYTRPNTPLFSLGASSSFEVALFTPLPTMPFENIFCMHCATRLQREVYFSDDQCVVVYDGYPKSRYHLLLLPKPKVGGVT